MACARPCSALARSASSLRCSACSLWTRDIAYRPKTWKRWSVDVGSPRKAGVILICLRPGDRDDPNEFCTEHYAHLYRIVEEYSLPVTIWDCDYPADATLSDCRKADMPATLVEK